MRRTASTSCSRASTSAQWRGSPPCAPAGARSAARSLAVAAHRTSRPLDGGRHLGHLHALPRDEFAFVQQPRPQPHYLLPHSSPPLDRARHHLPGCQESRPATRRAPATRAAQERSEHRPCMAPPRAWGASRYPTPLRLSRWDGRLPRRRRGAAAAPHGPAPRGSAAPRPACGPARPPARWSTAAGPTTPSGPPPPAWRRRCDARRRRRSPAGG